MKRVEFSDGFGLHWELLLDLFFNFGFGDESILRDVEREINRGLIFDDRVLGDSDLGADCAEISNLTIGLDMGFYLE